MRALTIAMVLLLCAGATHAASLHVEWGYTPPTEPALAGFELYKNGTEVYAWMNPDSRSGDADVDAPVYGDSFTLVALFDDETESPHSDAYVWGVDGTVIIITWRHWLWFFKPSHKSVKINATGLTGARIR